MFPNTPIISKNFITKDLDDESQFSKYVYLFIRCVDNQTRKLNNLGRSHLACLVLVYDKDLGLGYHCGNCVCGCCVLLVWSCVRHSSCNMLEYRDDEINR